MNRNERATVDRRAHEIDGQRQRALVDRRQAVGAGDRRDAEHRADAERDAGGATDAPRAPVIVAARTAVPGRRRAQAHPREQPARPSSGGSAAAQDEVGDDADDREGRDDRQQDVRARRTPRASSRRSGTARAWRSASRPGWPMAMRTPTPMRPRWARVSGTGSRRRRLLDRERQAPALHVAVLGDGRPADHVGAGLEREVGGAHRRLAVAGRAAGRDRLRRPPEEQERALRGVEALGEGERDERRRRGRGPRRPRGIDCSSSAWPRTGPAATRPSSSAGDEGGEEAANGRRVAVTGRAAMLGQGCPRHPSLPAGPRSSPCTARRTGYRRRLAAPRR